MKNIIIGGTCRSGKTLLAKALKSKLPNCNYLSVDRIRNALKRVYQKDYKHEYLLELQEFVFNLYNEYKAFQASGMFSIVEGVYITPAEVLARYNTDDNIIIFVGRPKLTAKQCFEGIRKNEKIVYSWTSSSPDEEIMELAEHSHVKDIENLEFCKNHGFLFLDTSFNQMETIQSFADELAKNLNKKEEK